MFMNKLQNPEMIYVYLCPEVAINKKITSKT